MMKYTSIIALVFLLIVFPVVSNSQTKRKSGVKKTQNTKKISDEVKVKKIVEQVIDGFFIKREFTPTIQKFFSLASCDKIDKDFLDQNCLSKDTFPFAFGQKLGFRTVFISLKHQFLPFYLILGTIPIDKDSEEAYPYSSSDFDELEAKILKKNDFSIHDIDYEDLNRKQLEQKMVELEKVNDELESIILKQINPTIYKENIDIMKETITIERKIRTNRKYYNVYIEGLIYSFILTKRNGELKIVGMDDPI